MVTLEMSQMVTNTFKLDEAPQVRHGRPVLVVPGAHGRLSNIHESGHFIKDEVFTVKNKQKVRKANTAAGNLMLSWRKLRDHGDEEMKSLSGTLWRCNSPMCFEMGSSSLGLQR